MKKAEKIKYFKDRVNYYFFEVFKLNYLTLNILENAEEFLDYKACVMWYPIEMGAGIIDLSYSLEWIEDITLTKEEINSVAFHEVMEAILSEIQMLCYERFIDKKDIPSAIHRVINTFENTIMDKL
jgi:hypothetical protein